MTLYWTKAASILGLSQINMRDSEVPISKKKARKDLLNLLQDNLADYTPPQNDREMIFEGWKMLCKKYSPIFLEKSPHHLLQWSALELIAEFIKKYPEIDVCIIGLVRNPMDALYSAFNRWGSIPECGQNEWSKAYRNLLQLKELIGEKLVIIRYEDMVSSIDCLKPILKFASKDIAKIDTEYMHSKSLSRWKKDKHYGFNLSREVLELSAIFGYSNSEILNEKSMLWPIYRKIYRFKKILKAIIKEILAKLKKGSENG